MQTGSEVKQEIKEFEFKRVGHGGWNAEFVTYTYPEDDPDAELTEVSRVAVAKEPISASHVWMRASIASVDTEIWDRTNEHLQCAAEDSLDYAILSILSDKFVEHLKAEHHHSTFKPAAALLSNIDLLIPYLMEGGTLPPSLAFWYELQEHTKSSLMLLSPTYWRKAVVREYDLADKPSARLAALALLKPEGGAV